MPLFSLFMFSRLIISTLLPCCSYKAHFRWKHYTQELAEGTEQPEGTEACASVTSAFLQVLATVHNIESSRLQKPRNILHILSTNTRRTKVVELSTGTHRVADELRRHSLSDGEGGHYSTNLDRNRYGSDNNYLFTVTRYNLECLGLCPCLVDIEIVDTRNGNESQLVTAGDIACSCNSPERAELADISHYAGSNPRAAPPSPHREMRRVASAGALNATGGLGMRRVPSSHAMRRNPSAGRLYEYGGAHPTHSRGSGGSDLFDALLMAATGDHDVRSHGEPPVSSHAPAGGRPIRAPGSGPSAARVWAHGSNNDLQDSLQNAVEALRGAPADEEDGAGAGPGGLARLGSGSAARGRRGMPRRNSVSMIIENPVLAQTGAGDSLIVGQQYYQAYLRGEGADGDREHSGEGEGEGDTDHGEDGAAGGGTDHAAGKLRPPGLLRQFQKQHSAVNLNTLGARAAEDVRRLQDEVRQLREEAKVLEMALEETKSAQKAAERNAEDAGASRRRAAATIEKLRAALIGAGIPDPTLTPDAAEEEVLRTSEQEIELLRAELADVKAVLAKAQAEKKEVEGKLRMASGPGLPRGNGMPPPSAAAAAAAAAAAFHMPYAMGMLPMFGMPPLNPFQGLHPPPQPPSQPSAFRALGSMQKVASMPAMHHGIMSPPADRDAKRKADSPIIEGDEGAESPPKRQAVEGSNGPEPPLQPQLPPVKPEEKGQILHHHNGGSVAAALGHRVERSPAPAPVAAAMVNHEINALLPSMGGVPPSKATVAPSLPAQI